MPSLPKPSPEADEAVRNIIFDDLRNRPLSAVVPVNGLVAYIRAEVPDTYRTDRQLARMVFDAAMQLGLVPVYDPQVPISSADGDFRGSYGYGHRAYRPDPEARYGFEPDGVRPLPVKPRSRWR